MKSYILTSRIHKNGDGFTFDGFKKTFDDSEGFDRNHFDEIMRTDKKNVDIPIL